MCVGFDGLRVLIVEDEAIVAMDLIDRIRELGALPVGFARKAAVALILLAELRPDAVLLDLKLSGIAGGLAAAEEIRTVSDAPIIFCTAYGDALTRARVELLRNAELLLKPVTDAALREALARVCHRSRLPNTRANGD
jgi:CheY-like chemotaxis protein